MEVADKKLSIGDWVEIVDSVLSGCKGFILSISPEANALKIQITRNSKGQGITGKTWLDFSQVIPYSIDHLEDDALHQLIDMTLDMKDEEWFNELTEKLALNNRSSI
jgi:hypothetical protein